jgi:hypothetical protein
LIPYGLGQKASFQQRTTVLQVCPRIRQEARPNIHEDTIEQNGLESSQNDFPRPSEK